MKKRGRYGRNRHVLDLERHTFFLLLVVASLEVIADEVALDVNLDDDLRPFMRSGALWTARGRGEASV